MQRLGSMGLCHSVAYEFGAENTIESLAIIVTTICSLEKREMQMLVRVGAYLQFEKS